jgi:formyltetrahydrofolate deformylase
MKKYILKIDCVDEVGLVYKITNLLFIMGVNIIINDEYVDENNCWFYMRTEFEGEINEKSLLDKLNDILPVKAEISLSTRRNKRIVILATKEHHCLSDLLIRNHFNELEAEILAVISNHDVLKILTEKFDIPFHYISHIGMDRDQHEEALEMIIDKYNPEYIVLAKYMRILTPSFSKKYFYKVINIHHSFLPAFIGANPYRQAYDRGVKIIGATAHFVNEALDEGPIIAQDVTHVSHAETPTTLSQKGKEVEKMVLAKALKMLFEDRIFVKNNKTVIFD